jgi:hypothetical protein
MRKSLPLGLRRAGPDVRRARALAVACAAVASLAVAPAPARADDPNVLERVVSVKRSPEGTSARLIDTPVLQIVRAEQERVAGGHREDVRIASSPLFSVFRRESITAAEGAVTHTQGEGRFASVLGISLLEWRSDKEHGMTGDQRTSESEWGLLTLPKLGALFGRKKTDAGSRYEVLYFLHFGAPEPDEESPPEAAPPAEPAEAE